MTLTPSPQGSDLLGALGHHARATPVKAAVTFLPDKGPPQSLTFAELDLLARQAGALLRDAAMPGERALLLYPTGLDFIVAFLGCLHAGLTAVPASIPTRARAKARTERIIRDAGAHLILGPDSLAATGHAALPDDPPSKFVPLAIDRLSGTDAPDAPHSPRPSSTAFLQYTSGSTSEPRGVVVSHAALTANMQAIGMGLGWYHTDTIVTWLPQFHDMGLVGNTLCPLYIGFTSVLLSPQAFLSRPARWLQAISEHRATITGGPNSAYELCARSIRDDEKPSIDLASLRVAYNGAEPIRAETLERFTQAFATCGFRPEAWSPCYGLAESTLFVAGGPPGRPARTLRVRRSSLASHTVVPLTDPGADVVTLVSSGQAWAGTEIQIVDPGTLRHLDGNTIGEIWTRGPSVATGYWNRPEDTTNVFAAIPADSSDAPAFLRTGDLGFKLDGDLYVTGRIKDLIIIRGRNIYPHDVEHIAADTIPFARNCAAFSLDRNNEERLALVIEADSSMMALDPELAATHGETLADQMRRAIAQDLEVSLHTFVIVKPRAIPRTTSGKVQRKHCQKMYLAGDLPIVFESSHHPVPDQALNLVQESETVELERSLERLAEGLDTALRTWLIADADRPDLPFDWDTPLEVMGLDSLGLARLLTAIEDTLGTSVDAEEVLKLGTIRRIAAGLATKALPGHSRPKVSHPLGSVAHRPIAFRDDAIVSIAFNVMPNRPVEERFVVSEYRVAPGYAEALFDREYKSSMLHSPDHLIVVTLQVHAQKLAYLALCAAFGLDYDPGGPELLKIWPVWLDIAMPKMVRVRNGVVQTLRVTSLKPGPSAGSYVAEIESRVEDMRLRSRCMVYRLDEAPDGGV